MTPSTNLPMTPESNAGVSPRLAPSGATPTASAATAAATPAHPESSTAGGAAGMEGQSFSRQNSSLAGRGGGGGEGNSSPCPKRDRSQANLHVESILGIKDDQPINSPLVSAVQASSPLGNSVKDGSGGGGGGGSAANSPHLQSPLGGMLAPNVTAPGRPDLLGFPVRSPSFRSESQPSPLTEDGKTVSSLKLAGSTSSLLSFFLLLLSLCRLES